MSADRPTDGTCLESVAQPIVVLLSAAQVQKSLEPHLLFYGSRSHVRPFLYFKSSDTLLTTQHEFQWRDEGMLDIAGACVVAMLLRSQCAVEYEESSYFDVLFRHLKYPRTGFMQAMRNSSIDLSKATLKSTSIPSKSVRKRPLEHQESTMNQKRNFNKIYNDYKRLHRE